MRAKPFSETGAAAVMAEIPVAPAVREVAPVAHPAKDIAAGEI